MKSDPRICERNLCNCVTENEQKLRTLINGVGTRRLAAPVRCSYHLSYKATDVRSTSKVSLYVPAKEMSIRTAEMK